MDGDLFESKLKKAESENRLRSLRTIGSAQGREIVVDGRTILTFSSNDYLGLANHPDVIDAAKKCIDQYGNGAGSSRLISGTFKPHADFENEIASFLGKESALLFSTGYAANVGLLTAIAGRGDYIFADRLSHASIIDGARLSGAKLARFAHNDPDDLERHLGKVEETRQRKLIVTEGVFSMDGDLAPLEKLANIARRHNAIFIVDDAHGLGLFGHDGRGSIDEAFVTDLVDIHIVTLGKSLGSSGGVVASSRAVIDGLINYSRSFIYSTAPPPACAAAASAALRIIKSGEGEKRRGRLFANIKLIKSLLSDTPYTVSAYSQIVDVRASAGVDITSISNSLWEGGIHAPAIRAPTVAKGSERLRISLTSEHSEEDIRLLVDRLGEIASHL